MKFIYLGKKKDFKLGDLYAHNDPLNHGDTFDLDGADIVLIRKVLAEAARQGIAPENDAFVLYSKYLSVQDDKEFYEPKEGPEQKVVDDNKVYDNKEEIEEVDEVEEVDLRELSKKELLQICDEIGVNANKRNITKQEIIGLIQEANT